MIARTWHGRAPAQSADAYAEHLERSVLPELEGLSGFRGLYLLRRAVPGGVAFEVVTFWESMEAIRSFAGESLDLAVVAPEAQALLAEFDPRVLHHEVDLERRP